MSNTRGRIGRHPSLSGYTIERAHATIEKRRAPIPDNDPAGPDLTIRFEPQDPDEERNPIMLKPV